MNKKTIIKSEIDLVIDTIGGLNSLTLKEEKALSGYFKKKKQEKRKPKN